MGCESTVKHMIGYQWYGASRQWWDVDNAEWMTSGSDHNIRVYNHVRTPTDRGPYLPNRPPNNVRLQKTTTEARCDDGDGEDERQ